MAEPGSKLVVCPYDKKHVMPERRYMWHLCMNCKAHVHYLLCKIRQVEFKSKIERTILCFVLLIRFIESQK